MIKDFIKRIENCSKHKNTYIQKLSYTFDEDELFSKSSELEIVKDNLEKDYVFNFIDIYIENNTIWITFQLRYPKSFGIEIW